MPEAMERDPLGDAFFAFRMQAPQEIRVPGASVARRTVKRRRGTRLAAAVAAVVLVALAGTGLATERRGGWMPSARVSTAPTLSAEQLDELGVQALERLGYQADASLMGVLYGGMGGPAHSSYTIGTSAEPLPAGDYSVRAVCVGIGQISVSWDDRGQTRRLPVVCGDDPAQSDQLRLVAPGTVKLRLSADAVAAGRAAAAVAVTDPRIVAARNALGTLAHQEAGGSGFVERNRSNGGAVRRKDVNESGTQPGDYTLVVACVGVGTIDATLSIGDATMTKTTQCQPLSAPPSPVSFTLRATRAGMAVTVLLDPDEVAAGAAGYAYAFTFQPRI